MMLKQRDRQQKEAEMRGKKRGAVGGMQKLPMGAKTKKDLWLVLGAGVDVDDGRNNGIRSR